MTAAASCRLWGPPLPPYISDIPLCDACELRHLGAVFAILEESGAGPSWVFRRYLDTHDVGLDEALRCIRRLDLTGASACSEERLLGVAAAVADMGVDPTDRRAVQRLFEDLAV